MCILKVAAIGVHLWSFHAPQNGFADSTQGVYVRNECGIQVGLMRNSERRKSFYASYAWDNENLFAVAGLMTGYESRKVSPLFIAGVKSGRLRVGYIPKIKNIVPSHTVHVSWEFTF